MNRYEKYKPSGIDWIGEIPEHWILNKFNRIAFYQEGPGLRNWQFTEDGVKVICVTNITENGIDFSLLNRCISKKEYEQTYRHFTVKKGDYLMSSSGASWGKVAEYLDDEKVILNTSTIRINTEDERKIKREFIKWLIKSPFITEQLNILLTGSCQPNFGPTHLSQLFVVYPSSTEEQLMITNYLDEKTFQISKLISDKRKLIELLKEERTAIINEAVGGKRKNWEKKKLKYVVSKVGSGVTPSGGASVYLQEGIPLLRSQNIFSDRLELNDVAYISEKIDEQMSNSRIQDDDVLLNITGASIGRCFYVPKNFGRGNVNQHVCLIRPIQTKIKTKYLHSFLISSFGQTLIDICQNGANREGLNFQQIKSFEIPLPSITEQNNILQSINGETQRINSTISKIEKEILLLQEYRTALISEAVTGKIDVRNAFSEKPDKHKNKLSYF